MAVVDSLALGVAVNVRTLGIGLESRSLSHISYPVAKHSRMHSASKKFWKFSAEACRD
jgi:hypothetical protein